MALYRNSLIFAVTTQPLDRAVAAAHSGSWSEQTWYSGSPWPLGVWQTLARTRAALLPAQCSVIGYKSQEYTVDGNKLLPGGSSAGRFLFPGDVSRSVDIPQAALELRFTVAGRINVVRQKIAALPDEVVRQGEYYPDSRFSSDLARYGNYLCGIGPGVGSPNVGFPSAAVVRDLSNPSARVRSITAAGLLTTTTSTGAQEMLNYIILKRVQDDRKRPVKGSFLVTDKVVNGDGSVTYTLDNYTGQIVTKPNGLARVDSLAVGTLANWSFGRVGVRKIGGPFEKYRGRRSKVFR